MGKQPKKKLVIYHAFKTPWVGQLSPWTPRNISETSTTQVHYALLFANSGCPTLVHWLCTYPFDLSWSIQSSCGSSQTGISRFCWSAALVTPSRSARAPVKAVDWHLSTWWRWRVSQTAQVWAYIRYFVPNAIFIGMQIYMLSETNVTHHYQLMDVAAHRQGHYLGLAWIDSNVENRSRTAAPDRDEIWDLNVSNVKSPL